MATRLIAGISRLRLLSLPADISLPTHSLEIDSLEMKHRNTKINKQGGKARRVALGENYTAADPQ